MKMAITMHEIENLSAEDLKARRAEILESLKQHTAEELAGRYLQARTDAKLRDEKLALQGEEIKQTNTLLQSANARADALGGELDKAKLECAAVQRQYEAIVPERQALKDQLVLQDKRLARIKNEALRGNRAMTSAVQGLTEAINAQRIEDLAAEPAVGTS